MLLSLLALPVLGLEAGEMAPDFELIGSDGATYRLSDYRGHKAVVLAWFPRAYSEGCTLECKSLTENGHLIRAFDVAYFMASVDSLDANTDFAAEQHADFPLLSDADKTVADAWGVLHPLGFAKRHTFYIGLDGRVLAVDRDVQPATSAKDIAHALGVLGVAPATVTTGGR